MPLIPVTQIRMGEFVQSGLFPVVPSRAPAGFPFSARREDLDPQWLHSRDKLASFDHHVLGVVEQLKALAIQVLQASHFHSHVPTVILIDQDDQPFFPRSSGCHPRGRLTFPIAHLNRRQAHARFFRRDQEWLQCRQLAGQGIKRFPKSRGFQVM